jgi:hypothetical protein
MAQHIEPQEIEQHARGWNVPLDENINAVYEKVNEHSDLIEELQEAGGSPGQDGAPGEDGKSVHWRGEWTSDSSYGELDAVSSSGSSWIAPVAIAPFGVAPGGTGVSNQWYSGTLVPEGGLGGSISTGGDLPIAVEFILDHSAVVHGARFSWAANEGTIKLRIATAISPTIVYLDQNVYDIPGPDYSGNPNEVIFPYPASLGAGVQYYLVFLESNNGYMQLNALPRNSMFRGLNSIPNSYNGENLANNNPNYTVWFELLEEREYSSAWELMAAKGDVGSGNYVENSIESSEGVIIETDLDGRLSQLLLDSSVAQLSTSESEYGGVSFVLTDGAAKISASQRIIVGEGMPHNLTVNNYGVFADGVPLGGLLSGDTGSRPADPAVGVSYFDTTVGKPIWVQSLSPVVWVDATGTVV